MLGGGRLYNGGPDPDGFVNSDMLVQFGSSGSDWARCVAVNPTNGDIVVGGRAGLCFYNFSFSGWHARHKNNRRTTVEQPSEIRTVLEAYWLVRAPVPISCSRGSHSGLGGDLRCNPEQTFLRGRGAAADALNGWLTGAARQ